MIEVKEMKETIATANSVFAQVTEMKHEQVVFCYDHETGLKAIIAIHNTNLGPALGGTRMWMYQNENDALTDVLRLSRGMTYKAAISGLNLGGGKAVIIGDSKKDKTEALFRKFGQYVNSLSGRYITAEDVGTSTKDMEYISKETKHVTGLPESMGGSGDPSPVTAYGVYMGMKASAKEVWGNDSLSGKKVCVQGAGHVGSNLVKHLTEEGAKVYVTDINKDALQQVATTYKAEVVAPDSIFSLDVDIYAPCALGATLNTENISKLKCAIVSGAANNQLADEVVHSKMLMDKGILWAPDFLINAGGLINVYSELKKFSRAEALKQTEHIYNVTLEIFKKSKTEKIPTLVAAMQMAEKRIYGGK
ncbi:MAG: Glu/Leu/Phe/Val dehydrogenase [Bacteroidia bacterium]|jgi:leucine dehydrogenase|nr:Glu/Leu/Phe/Val dehydrogenase [Bacteroidia bacterium]MBP7715378.1 Glu/Leu/Phe/Val dehydrogenase [Bacteroidia bacterium]MBP8669134.1 Glu/Leu/Phe/Val dehydrogenase [Bacteroidia bacterium]HQW18043.1 Glu/Leu/Phe/Val dehydrogenase [Bacteroidia bacterium]HQW49363.1 Glu/Leu/Phe/Val dehydrogenase [Bacteroidia bacterium]